MQGCQLLKAEGSCLGPDLFLTKAPQVLVMGVVLRPSAAPPSAGFGAEGNPCLCELECAAAQELAVAVSPLRGVPVAGEVGTLLPQIWGGAGAPEGLMGVAVEVSSVDPWSGQGRGTGFL